MSAEVLDGNAGDAAGLFLANDREGPERLAAQRVSVLALAGFELFFSMPMAFLVLNDRRQILLFNEAARELCQPIEGEIIGLRPGEALGCADSCLGSDGCGTGLFCRYCGAARAISGALHDRVEERECHMERMLDNRLESLDVGIWSRSFILDSKRFVLLVLENRSALRRRESLERAFMHDLLNSVTALDSLVSLMVPAEGVGQEYGELARNAVVQIEDEIHGHRALVNADFGRLEPDVQIIEIGQFLAALGRSQGIIAALRGIALELDLQAAGPVMIDPVLFKRVLMNLLKNAIEASGKGDRILLSSAIAEDNLIVRVGNRAAIPAEIQKSIFKRNISSKGKGRGLGTYTAHLFVEEYLGGRIGFTTDAEAGTVFTVSLPILRPNSPPAA